MSYDRKLQMDNPPEESYIDVNIMCNNHSNDMIFNFSHTLVCDLIAKHQQAKIFYPETEVILQVVYTMLMISGIISNLLVCFVVMRQCVRKRTDLGSSGPKSRNLYIVNLAVADLALCCICMPFTLLSYFGRWTLGSLICKLLPVVEGTNIIVSSGTITAIAFDRYITIVRSPRSRHLRNNACCNVIVTIVIIWVLGFIVTSPLFFYTTVDKVTFENFYLYDQCVEKWPSHALKCVFTIALAIVQFVIPVLVLTVIHLKISAYLKLHLKPINKSKPKIEIHSPMDQKKDIQNLEINDEGNNEDDGKDEKDDSSKKGLLNINKRKESICSENSQKSYESCRKSSDCSRKLSESSRKNSDCSDTKRSSCDISPRKRSDFLTSFRETSDFSGFSFSRFSEKSKSSKNHKRARRELRRNRRTMFMLSCIAIVYAVSWLPWTLFHLITIKENFSQDPQTIYLVFASCHILAMSTAITNPLLYGWLNTNFRREFIIIFSSISSFFSQIFKREFKASLNNNKSNAINNNNTNKNNVNNFDDKVFLQMPQKNDQSQNSYDRKISLTYVNNKKNSTVITVPTTNTQNLQL